MGLTDKESAVYLAALQLGPSPVQPISRKSKVARATTYVVLDTLMNRGLVTQYKEGKKTLFAAQPPEALRQYINHQEEQVEARKHKLDTLLPKLQAYMKTVEDRPVVRYFSGREGLQTMRREMVMYSSAEDTWCSFVPMDHLFAVFGEREAYYTQQRLSKGIKSKSLFTTTSEDIKNHLLSDSKKQGALRKFIPPDRFRSTSGMTIYKDRIAVATYSGNIGGIIIESESVARMLSDFFDLVWDSIDNE